MTHNNTRRWNRRIAYNTWGGENKGNVAHYSSKGYECRVFSCLYWCRANKQFPYFYIVFLAFKKIKSISLFNRKASDEKYKHFE